MKTVPTYSAVGGPQGVKYDQSGTKEVPDYTARMLAQQRPEIAALAHPEKQYAPQYKTIVDPTSPSGFSYQDMRTPDAPLIKNAPMPPAYNPSYTYITGPEGEQYKAPTKGGGKPKGTGIKKPKTGEDAEMFAGEASLNAKGIQNPTIEQIAEERRMLFHPSILDQMKKMKNNKVTANDLLQGGFE
jgi:hypothetical protein